MFICSVIAYVNDELKKLLTYLLMTRANTDDVLTSLPVNRHGVFAGTLPS